ncbi:hypothetical protein FV232_27945 [Methylobacterium sp. WL30]|uniref:hypothetical protein n=1 Tax=unclassified Methylobacterium TaxID=2615210 RepID=UPI0011CAB086|nr:MULTISPECIES: hypothetical protein [unclassified Methylobacterium]TXN29100.1 hypothetical protein FV225_20675 [Methylobacterium sp. WL93]TXN46116.1 hypothetical protein FV227_24005 [Methylobacterium sp. WL119]TXN60680.1 hypothetical protein FV232_27945 [Methylobacterium sp. WL30]
MDARDNVETLLVLQPILVDTGSPDREGRLVLANGLLIAVLVRLDTPDHEMGRGWFVEAAFGRLFGVLAPIFDTLEEATRWLRQHRKA